MGQADAIAVQQAYDQLPHELRVLLMNAPIKVSASFALAYYQRHGLADTILRVNQGIAMVMADLEGG